MLTPDKQSGGDPGDIPDPERPSERHRQRRERGAFFFSPEGVADGFYGVEKVKPPQTEKEKETRAKQQEGDDSPDGKPDYSHTDPPFRIPPLYAGNGGVYSPGGRLAPGLKNGKSD